MIRTLTGDCRALLPTLAAGSVDCVVTSPPYFGLRDYGTAQWEGGEAGCGHVETTSRQDGGRTGVNGFNGSARADSHKGEVQFRDLCGKCGARRIDSQIGLEATPEAYVAEMVAVFREVRRVLKDDGTVWLNLGDSYNANQGSGFDTNRDGGARKALAASPKVFSGLPPKNLLMIPARVALALQADGWWLRSHIIWAKPNPMPESVTDRPTSAHESVFLLTKRERYFYDAEAVREPHSRAWWGETPSRPGNPDRKDGGGRQGAIETTGRNLRNVWTIASAPFAEAHFATFPPALAERCIKAGTSEKGCCAACGKPWERVVTASSGGKRSWHDHAADVIAGQSQCKHGQQAWDSYQSGQTLGWSPSCACGADVVPAVVLDPFGGAGTVGLVADRLGRDAILIDLNPDYVAMGRARMVSDAPLFVRVVEA